MKTATTFLTRSCTRLCLAALATLFTLQTAHADRLQVTEGMLEVLGPDGQTQGHCPLEHTDVSVDISGFIARVTVTQHFKNPINVPIEAVYTFPLSERGAVDRMVMQVGDRIINGVIKTKEEARQTYEQARNAGKTASLLDQERPNIFTQSVANIMPSANIEVTISYVEYLKYEDGEYEFSFPMVVGPRYIPGQPTLTGGTTQVPDANRITPPITPEGARAGHDIGLTVNLDAGMPLQKLESTLHKVNIQRPGEKSAIVHLKNQKEIPNRDFILKYSVAADSIGDAILTHTGENGNYFTLILQPPRRVAADAATPKEMIFVIDCSGSMYGFPLDKAKETMEQAIKSMNPHDTFNLISFAGGVGYCFNEPQPNTPANRQAALGYLANLQGGGGTEMMGAIRAALTRQPLADNRRIADRLRVVCFMTDGYIGNEAQILDEIKKSAGSTRVFSFGIGDSINRFLIENMARVGRGEAEIVTLASEGSEAADRFAQRIHSPLLTNISLDFGDMKVSEVYPDPNALPDLFSAKPLVITGKYHGSGDATITLKGQTATGALERSLGAHFPTKNDGNDVLAPLWARTKIDSLMAQNWVDGLHNQASDISAAITDLGLAYNLVTQYTSFVAVENRVVNENGAPVQIEVPVEMPNGVSYEGIFGAASGGRMQLSKSMPIPASPVVSGSANILAESAADPGVFRDRDEMRRMVEQVTQSAPKVEHETLPNVLVDRRNADSNETDKPKEAHFPDDIMMKLPPELRGIEQKVKQGAYSDGKVKVVDGEIRITVHFTGEPLEILPLLYNLNAHIISVNHSNNSAMIRIPVEMLRELAQQEWVVKVAL